MKTSIPYLAVSLFVASMAYAGEWGTPRTIVIEMQGTSDGGGVPNPASVACKKLGGYVDMMEFPRGQSGVCRLEWAMIPDWTLFRKTLGNSSSAVTAFLKRKYERGTGPIETWAVQYCESIGGRIEVGYETFRPTAHHQFCNFPDRSTIEAWTLFYGADYSRVLADILENVTVVIKE